MELIYIRKHAHLYMYTKCTWHDAHNTMRVTHFVCVKIFLSFNLILYRDRQPQLSGKKNEHLVFINLLSYVV